MSYQVHARKWRPSNFAQVAGQAHVLKSLINALDNQRLHHAYLFTGTRGVGKTTLARILAKCLNCEAGVSSTPCETCDSCREISEGRFIDLIEVDAASRTKVEDTRELLDNVQYTPSRGRYKVYLIDEVHMLSTHSFNALLKTLEEPPPHVKFLFATTDPQKLPITVLSRCLQFNLKNLSPQQITEYLDTVLKKEAITFEEEALWQIAASANGSMRDALTLVDQAISYCEGSITTDGVVEMLGIPEQGKVFTLLEKMSTGDVQEVLAVVRELAEYTPDYMHSLDGLLSVLHRVALAQILPDAIDNSTGDKARLLSLATALTAEDVQLYYQMGIRGRDDLRLSADARSAFEMLLLRMMVFSPNYVAVKNNSDGEADADSPPVEKKKTNAAELANSPVSATATEAAMPHDTGADVPTPLSANPAPAVAASQASVEENQQPAPVASPSTPPPTSKEPSLSPAQAKSSSATPSNESAVTPIAKLQGDAAVEVASSVRVKPAEPTAVESRAAAKSAPQVSKAAPAVSAASSVAGALPTLQDLTHAGWLRVYQSLKVSGIVGNVLANSELTSVDGSTLHFVLDASQSAVFSEELIPKLENALSDYFDTAVRVAIDCGEVMQETPAMLGQRLKQERHNEMVNEFEHDENVQELVRHFSGIIAKDSISPLND